MWMPVKSWLAIWMDWNNLYGKTDKTAPAQDPPQEEEEKKEV